MEIRKANTTVVVTFFLALLTTLSSAQQLWGTLKAGSYKVGFRVIRERDSGRNNRPMVLCVWYPTAEEPGRYPFKEYLFTGIINRSFADPSPSQKDSALREFKGVLEIPAIMNLPTIPDDKFLKVVNGQVPVAFNSTPINQKFPLVLIKSEPESISVTCEYLASHGFVVVVVHAPYDTVDPPDSRRYYSTTRDLLWVLDHFPPQLQQFVDLRKIGALGFAGGIMPSFYLTMITSRVKALVNIDGHIFQPVALTSKSVDFHPGKMNTPMLHIVTVGTHKNESPVEENAIKPGLLYKVYVKDNRVRHQDFSVFGRIALHGLAMRGVDSSLAEEAFNNTHQMILDFFNKLLKENHKEFELSQSSFQGLQVQRK